MARSTRIRSLRTRSPLRDDFAVPLVDFGAQPELRAPASKVDDWARHVCVLALVLADGVAVGETKQIGNLMRVDQFVDVDFAAHSGDDHTPVSGDVVLSGRRVIFQV